ncbi:MAG: hypothetical protein JSW40_05325, partial [Candidatus Omnitrophota bacterium]
LNYPATGDKWPITPKTKLIDFDTTGDVDDVEIWYSSTGGSPYTSIGTKTCGAEGNYTWTWSNMPDAVTTTARIKITHNDVAFEDDV